MSRRSKVALLVMAAFVAFVEGPLNPFWIWNVMPIALAYFVLRGTFDDPRLHLPGVVFAVVACFLVVFTHIAWMFDLRSLATSSSTADLIFVVAPIYSLLAAAIGWTTAWGVVRIRRQRGGENGE